MNRIMDFTDLRLFIDKVVSEYKLSAVYFQHVFNWDIRIQNEFRNVVYKCID